MAREIMTGIRMGQHLAVSMIASNSAYNPDIADDLARRTAWMFGEALQQMDDVDLIEHEYDNDDDDYPESDTKELQDPRIVRFMDSLEEDSDA